MTNTPVHMLSELVSAARLTLPDDLADVVSDQARALGATAATVYLADHDQYALVPLPSGSDPAVEVLPIDTTLAGRCYRQLETQRTEGPTGSRLFVPILDGLERLGVLELILGGAGAEGADPGAVEPDEVEAFAALVAQLLVSKKYSGDIFHIIRRRQPMSLAAEIAWNLLPPLTFGTREVVISAVLAPAYDVGGDCFDYGAGRHATRFALFDAMGHGLGASWLATVAMAAYRRARRERRDLSETVAAVDEAVATTFGDGTFVTAVFGELDGGTGRLRWSLAGHPAPLLLRSNRVVKTLEADSGLPLGLGAPGAVSEESLEPGDRVLAYTDGVVEARSETGAFFGLERLADFMTRAGAEGQPPPETLRRLMHAILEHQEGELQDDATTMMVEWRGQSLEHLVPAEASAPREN